MRLLASIALFAFSALIALEGFSPEFQKNQITQVTQLITFIGKEAQVDVSAVIPHLVHLKYVAISALAVVVLRFHGFFIALYLILTRALNIVNHVKKIYPVAIAGDINKLSSAHANDLTYLLTSVGLIAYFISVICFGGSRKAKIPKAPKADSSKPKAPKADANRK